MAAAAILNFENINSFRKNEAITTKFQHNTPGTNLYRTPRVDMRIFQNPRWRRPPSWISKIFIVSARMKRFSPNFNRIHLALAFIDPESRYANFRKSKMAAAAILISKNINSFRKNEAILTKFQQHTPGTSLYRSRRADMRIFENPRWRRPPSWISKNINSFRKNEAITTKFQQSTPSINLYRTPRVDMRIFQNPRWRRPPSFISKNINSSARMKRFPPNINSINLALTFIEPQGRYAYFPKSKMAAAAILNFEKY